MKIVLSQPFKDDLLQAETHYFGISATLGEKFHARVKQVIRSIVRWVAEIMSVHTDIRANVALPFRGWFTMRKSAMNSAFLRCCASDGIRRR